MNHVGQLVKDWGWWNRVYTRLLIRLRGYQLVSAAKVLPVAKSLAELPTLPQGGLFWLEERINFKTFRPPAIALGADAGYVCDYYRKEYAVQKVRPFISYFKNALLYGRQFSILDSRKRAFEECFTRDRRWRKGVPKRNEKLAPRKISGTYRLACAESHNHFCHLFCDVLPRLKLYEEAPLSESIPYILPPVSHGFAEEANQLMGLWNNGSIQWDDGCWQIEGLYFASSFKKFCSWTPESVTWTRNTLCPKVEHKPLGGKLYYITRRNAFRPALNEEEMLTALQSWGLTVVEPDRLSLREQIALFSDARLIMGPHGAGIQNALWAPQGCAMLELVSPRYFSGIYWTLAESLGNPYGLVTGHTPQDGIPTQVGTLFNSDLIQRALEKLLQP